MAEPVKLTRDIHVAVFAFPFGSHAFNLLNLTSRLAMALPTAHFSFFSTAKSNSGLRSKHSTNMYDNIRFHDVADGVPEGYVFKGNPEEYVGLFLTAARDGFRDGVAAAELAVGKRVTSVVADAFFWFVKEMAVPWVAYWAGGPWALSAHLYTDLIRETIGLGDLAGCEQETVGFIPGMSKFLVKNLPEGILYGNLDSPFSRMLHQIGTSLSQASSVIINFCEELIDPQMNRDFKSKFKGFLSIASFSISSPQTQLDRIHPCIQWLGLQKPATVAYIAFGTIMPPPPSELLAIAEGLEASKIPFIWSLNEKDRVNLPEGFIDRTRDQGMVVAWAPQVELLAHGATGVFLTHCGWNSVLESIAGGVPMICRPLLGDHALNGRTVEDVWKIGVRIEGEAFTKEGVVRCLDRVLVQESGKKMRENVVELKGLAQKAGSPGGSTDDNLRSLIELIVK